MSRSDLVKLVDAQIVALQLSTGEPKPKGYLRMNKATVNVLMAGHPQNKTWSRGEWENAYWRGIPIYVRAGMADWEVEAIETSYGYTS